jgi:3-oxoacyl-[acyl-carrier-protein] synthase II
MAIWRCPLSRRFSSGNRRTDARIRIDVEFTVLYKSADGEQRCAAHLEELGYTGASFLLSEPRDLSQALRLELPSADGSEAIRLHAKLAWQRERIRYGVKFRTLSEAQVQVLKKVMHGSPSSTPVPGDRRHEERRADVLSLREDLDRAGLLLGDIRLKLSERVAITGIGIVSAIGIGSDSVWTSIQTGKSGIAPLTDETLNPLHTRVEAAIARDFRPEEFIEPKALRRLHRQAQMSSAAATLALRDSAFERGRQKTERIGVFEGTSVGGIESVFEEYKKYIQKGPERVNPVILVSGGMGESTAEISLMFGLHGPSQTITTGSASGADAIGTAYRAIKDGYLDLAFAGGSEAPIFPMSIDTFHRMGVEARTNDHGDPIMRPFDKRRNGFVLGEGAAFLILENWNKAKKRGARIYAELAGYAGSCDAHHASSSDPLGRELAFAVNEGMRGARCSPGEIDYVNLHGTATEVGDVAETRAMKLVFGERSSRVAFSSTKPFTGHTLGASGALEAAITSLAIFHQFAPPTLNLEIPDKDCDLDYVAGQGRAMPIRYALSVNSGFGGKNAVLVFRAVG